MELQVTRPVGDIAVEMPASIPYLEGKGIDYCCGGKRSLGEACAKAGADSEEVIQALRQMVKEGEVKRSESWPSLDALVQHILDKHHAYTREQLALVVKLGTKVAMVHGQRHPELNAILRVTEEMAEELLHHMMKEEQVAFPYLRTLDRKGNIPMFPFEMFQGGPERALLMDHETTGGQMSQLRDLTNGYAAPVDACVTFRAFYQGLKDLEQDIHLHIHLENNVLFPMAEKAAETVGVA